MEVADPAGGNSLFPTFLKRGAAALLGAAAL